MHSKRIQSSAADKLGEPNYFKRLFIAGSRASSLGMAILDDQTRFESVNRSLARETRAAVDHHVGKTSREVVGDLARQIEPVYERVLRTRESASVMLRGHVRDTPEFGYWLDHCFPILDRAGRVQQLGLFVVNVTAEKASAEIFDALPLDPKRLKAEAAGVLEMFDEAIRQYHRSLRQTFNELACPFAVRGKKVDRFRRSVERMDADIERMRELIYAMVAHFSIPEC
jgi:PAS fold